MGVFGIGGKDDNSVTQVTNSIASTTYNAILSTNNSCRTNVSATQTQKIVVGVTPELIAGCARAFGNIQGMSPDVIASTCTNILKTSGVNVNGVNQSATIKISGTCQFDETNIANLQSEIATAMQQTADTANDPTAQGVKSLCDGLAAFSPLKGITDLVSATKNQDNSRHITANISNFVTNNFTKENVNEMLRNYVTAQDQVLSISGASSVQVQNINQELFLTCVENMLSKNEGTVQALQKLSTTVEQSAKTSDAPVPAASFASGAIVSIVIVVIIAYIGYLALKKKGMA